jgi:hypothetical protein
MFGGLSIDVIIVGFIVVAAVSFIVWVNRRSFSNAIIYFVKSLKSRRRYLHQFISHNFFTQTLLLRIWARCVNPEHLV